MLWVPSLAMIQLLNKCLYWATLSTTVNQAKWRLYYTHFKGSLMHIENGLQPHPYNWCVVCDYKVVSLTHCYSFFSFFFGFLGILGKKREAETITVLLQWYIKRCERALPNQNWEMDTWWFKCLLLFVSCSSVRISTCLYHPLIYNTMFY